MSASAINSGGVARAGPVPASSSVTGSAGTTAVAVAGVAIEPRTGAPAASAAGASVGVCSGRYIFCEAPPGALPGPLDVCEPTLASIREQDDWLNNVPRPTVGLPRLTTQNADAKAGSAAQIRTSLESDVPAPMFSWPLVR